jgi:sugar/nucleoside kinase (ribokinase family)
MNTPELREKCAEKLLAASNRATQLTAFAGLDGFVDEIIHVVDKRDNAELYQRIPTIAKLSQRLTAAAGKSTNIELVNQRTKLGGNGPILANALASFGLKVIYLGALGYPNIHPVFSSFGKRAEIYSIGEPGHTDALEFEDGKLMLGKTVQLKEVNWMNIQERFGREKFAAHFATADLVAFVNWTMIPYMTEIWEALQSELCPALTGPPRSMFFDLADPEKRLLNDISRALEYVIRFQEKFDVILGLNEKEAFELAKVMGIAKKPATPEGLAELAREIVGVLEIGTLVIHPVRYALAASGQAVDVIDGPFVPDPLITTGAGDHFNSGFCLGKLLGFDNELSVLTGVTTSGYYVRSAKSPSIPELVGMLRDWPKN